MLYVDNQTGYTVIRLSFSGVGISSMLEGPGDRDEKNAKP